MTEAKMKYVSHSLDDYDGLTVKDFIAKLLNDDIPQDAIFEPNAYSDGEVPQFEYKRLETEAEVQRREQCQAAGERAERAHYERLKAKYEV
ncbi:MAG: hypothetical protein QQN63_00730 [Nitrosopumilus sp.]